MRTNQIFYNYKLILILLRKYTLKSFENKYNIAVLIVVYTYSVWTTFSLFEI